MADMDLSHPVWRKSRRSGNGGNCVEIAELTARIGVRDSKAPDKGHLSFSPEAWVEFVTEARDGRFDLS